MTPSRGGEGEEVEAGAEAGAEKLSIVVAEAACHIIGPVLAPLSVSAAQAGVLLVPLGVPESAAMLPEISAVSVAMLPVRFTMSVGTAAGVAPSGEPPSSWEPVYTPALLIALRCS